MKKILLFILLINLFIFPSFADNSNKQNNIILISCTTKEQEQILGYRIRIVKISNKKYIIIEKNVIVNNKPFITITITPTNE